MDVQGLVDITLYDSMGRMVKQERTTTRGRVIELGVEGLADGLYTCAASADDIHHQPVPFVIKN